MARGKDKIYFDQTCSESFCRFGGSSRTFTSTIRNQWENGKLLKWAVGRNLEAEDEANVEDTAYPGKEDGLDSLSFMAWAKAALMTFSEDMLIRRTLLSVMWVRNPNQKSSASQWLNGSHHPPLAQTPFAALRSSREAGELSWVDFKRDDSQSEVFYYAIFISSKTGLGGWSQWSMKMY
ncbi:unnamed protein product [Lactuca saligna]|uniref:Uncharacterized protein n=1 Tax=Lactuca saligna TaxID=75948 RepID=A0AA35VMR9_LACSI|nr:unnamed protein product [Lactuca saligna]